MSRNPSPSAVHELRGSYDKNPQRRRHGEPQPKAGVGPCPVPELAEYWDYIVAQACVGVLGDADRLALELAADLMKRHREGAMTSAERKDLISLLSRFGMTPSDRAKLALPGKPKADGWDDL